MFTEYETHFGGKPVALWTPETEQDPEHITYRVAIDWDEAEKGVTWNDRFAEFLEDPNVGKTTGLVIGHWGEVATGDSPEEVVEALTAAREKLPGLKALFLGDILMEESEISWIVQCDVSPLFEAYPGLETLRLRGSSNGLSLGALRHAHLKALIIESGGLDPDVVREVAAAELPALEHLELWLGTPDYGGDATLEDLRPILQGDLFPCLTYLGLRNSEIADAIAQALADAPITRRLHTLDLSLGTLTDEGIKPLLYSPAIAGLNKLDLHHHYLSKELTAQLSSEVPPSEQAGQLPMDLQVQQDDPSWKGIEIDVRDRQEPSDWGGGDLHRYVAVGE